MANLPASAGDNGAFASANPAAPNVAPAATAAESAPASNATAATSGDQAEQHEHQVERHEAYEYWGYLFKSDKTGTDKLKNLLRGLKNVMNTEYEPSDSPDLTPTQLAYFYRELHGNYDQLFLGTPSDSIAFIYKSLGCLHSLQPLPHSTAFTDPTVPALKTEGWIMWQTIQLLLGPEEHSSFLIEALQRWDVKDPSTGEIFPKILPKECFPTEPDKHMVAWYEGVSERLRREAEEEERQHEVEAEKADVRRLRDRGRREDTTDDESSLDSRGPALAYFRNPLYRHIDGRPTIVRHNSKRSQISPRPANMVDKGKEAANTLGHVIRNVGSPHLWDGPRPSKSRSRERDRDRRRRSSYPENRYPSAGDGPTPALHDSDHRPPSHHRRHASFEPPAEGYDAEEGASHPPRSSSRHSRHHHDDYDPALRHSRSHEPTPSQKEYPDYFAGYDEPDSRRNSGTPPAGQGFGPSFGPSASPLFASHIAKQPQPQPPRMPPGPDPYANLRQSPSIRRARGQGRPYSRSPDPLRSRTHDDRDPRRYDSPRRTRFESGPAPGYDDYDTQSPVRSSHGPPPMGPHQHSHPGYPPSGGGPGPGPGPSGPYPPSGQRERRGSRFSMSDHGGADDRDRRPGPPQNPPQKQTRFAAGVDGRRYPAETPWR